MQAKSWVRRGWRIGRAGPVGTLEDRPSARLSAMREDMADCDVSFGASMRLRPNAQKLWSDWLAERLGGSCAGAQARTRLAGCVRCTFYTTSLREAHSYMNIWDIDAPVLGTDREKNQAREQPRSASRSASVPSERGDRATDGMNVAIFVYQLCDYVQLTIDVMIDVTSSCS